MKKTILALAAAATIAAGTLATPQAADARCRGCGVGLGVFGGFVAGTILGAALANHPGYYRYDWDGPAPYGCPYGPGYWARQPIYDRNGNQIGWSKPHYFCD